MFMKCELDCLEWDTPTHPPLQSACGYNHLVFDLFLPVTDNLVISYITEHYITDLLRLELKGLVTGFGCHDFFQFPQNLNAALYRQRPVLIKVAGIFYLYAVSGLVITMWHNKELAASAAHAESPPPKYKTLSQIWSPCCLWKKFFFF